jgi:hypothetical protein
MIGQVNELRVAIGGNVAGVSCQRGNLKRLHVSYGWTPVMCGKCAAYDKLIDL